MGRHHLFAEGLEARPSYGAREQIRCQPTQTRGSPLDEVKQAHVRAAF